MKSLRCIQEWSVLVVSFFLRNYLNRRSIITNSRLHTLFNKVYLLDGNASNRIVFHFVIQGLSLNGFVAAATSAVAVRSCRVPFELVESDYVSNGNKQQVSEPVCLSLLGTLAHGGLWCISFYDNNDDAEATDQLQLAIVK
jgi:hypothetical protein